MKTNSNPCALLGHFLLFLTIIPLALGCGGSSASGGSGGGGTTDLAIAYDMTGFSGTLQTALSESASPQTVKVNVNGVLRTVSNVIVAKDITAGSQVVLLSEGSKVVNAVIPNAGLGATLGQTSFKVPLSPDGVLQASVIAQNLIEMTTPAAEWQGQSFSNGFLIRFFSATQGDHHVRVDSAMKLASDVRTLTGTLPVTYTSTASVDFSIKFTGTDLSYIEFAIDGIPATDGTLAAPWKTTRLTTGKLNFTNAIVSAFF